MVAYPIDEGVELNSDGSAFEYSRVLTVPGICDENSDDCGIDVNKIETEQRNVKAGECENENVLDQLLEGEEVMNLNIPQENRKAEDGGEVGAKKQKGFSVKDVGEKTVISLMSELAEVMDKNVKATDRFEKLMVDQTCVMSKLADSYSPIAEPSIIQGHYLGSALFITEYCYFRTVMSQRLH